MTISYFINSLWLWRWLPHRLSKCQSLSITTVLFRTTFTQTIKLNLLLKWPLGWNLSHYMYIIPWNTHACDNGTEHYRLQYTISTCISSNLLRWIHDSLSIMWFFNDLYVIFIWKHDLFKKNSNTQFSLGEEEMFLPTLSDLHKKTSENLEVKIFPTLSRR